MDRKTTILSKVLRLYQRYGIKSVTMDDVAQHLGISKKTLYEFFTGKEDLVKQVLLFQDETRCSEFFKIEYGNLNAIEELFEVYRMFKEIFKDYNPSIEFDVRKYYPSLFTEIRETKRKRIYELAVNNMNKGKKEGLYRSELNEILIAKLHVLQIENILDSDLFTTKELTSSQVFHELIVYHLNGVLNQEGRRFLEENFKKSSQQRS